MKRQRILLLFLGVGFLAAGSSPATFRTTAADPPAAGEPKASHDAPPTDPAAREKLRQLLKSSDSAARLRAAVLLARVADAEAISTLIDLLGELRGEKARETEDFLVDLAGDLGPKERLGDAAATPVKVRDAWAKWWRETDGDRLLKELKNRTIADADRAQVQALVQKLGSTSFAERKKTEDELIRLGVPILPLLKQAEQDPDAEVRSRVQRCVAILERAQQQSLSFFTLIGRLLALRKPAGTAETILACMPSIDDECIEELQQTLDLVGYTNGKPQPAVLEALKDKSPIRRAAAARALCAGPWSDHAAAIRQLLTDPQPRVRLKTAIALVSAGDAATVPILITLIAGLPADLAAQAEDYLNQVAGESAPKDLPDGPENLKKRSAAWSNWWSANKDRVALVDVLGRARLERFRLIENYHGYTLLVQQQSNSVVELDAGGKPRWTLKDLASPCDAQVVSGQHVLVVEFGNRVTERNMQGQVLWQKQVPGVISAQRLRNGNTFIVCSNQVLEVNRAGKEVLKVDRGGNNGAVGGIGGGNGGGIMLVFGGGGANIQAGRKLPNGRIVLFESNQIVQLDAKGRQTKSVASGAGGAGCNEVLDDGHVLVSSPGNGNLIEFDADGKEVHRFDMQGVSHGYRLPNGHVLVTIGQQKYVELDKNWRQIKETALTTPAFRVKRR